MCDVDWERHVEGLTRWHPEVIQELLDTSVSSRDHMRGHGTLGFITDHRHHPSGLDLVSELHHIDGQVARIPYMNLDSYFLYPVLIFTDTREAFLVHLREPDSHVIHLGAI